jgi:hypothetical protein
MWYIKCVWTHRETLDFISKNTLAAAVSQIGQLVRGKFNGTATAISILTGIYFASPGYTVDKNYRHTCPMQRGIWARFSYGWSLKATFILDGKFEGWGCNH